MEISRESVLSPWALTYTHSLAHDTPEHNVSRMSIEKKKEYDSYFRWEVMVEARAKQIHNKLGKYKHLY